MIKSFVFSFHIKKRRNNRSSDLFRYDVLSHKLYIGWVFFFSFLNYRYNIIPCSIEGRIDDRMTHMRLNFLFLLSFFFSFSNRKPPFLIKYDRNTSCLCLPASKFLRERHGFTIERNRNIQNLRIIRRVSTFRFLCT